MRQRPLSVVFVLLLPLCVAADWVAVDMGDPPAGYRSPNPKEINDKGQVVGTVYTGNFEARMFLWDDGDWTILPTLGGTWFWITGFNNRGQVVGFADTDDIGECFDYSGYIYCEPLVRGFLYEDGQIEELGPVGSDSYAGGISASGEVAGNFETAEGWVHGRWDASGRFNVMDTEGFGASPDGINSRGQVIGGWSCPSWHAFLWNPGEGMLDLGTLGGPGALGTAINENGLVVGHSDTDRVWGECEVNEWGTFCSYEMLAFTWEDGVMTALPSLGGQHTQPTGVNERGVIVGSSATEEQRCQTYGAYTSCTDIYHAVVWQDGELIDLGTPGKFSSAQDINNRGEIVGFDHTGPVIWRPVP